MYCNNCGKLIEEKTMFCPYCGFRFSPDNLNASSGSSTVRKNKVNIVGNLVLFAIALVLVGIAIYYFNLAHETLYTINGIDTSEVPGQRIKAVIALISGIGIAIGTGTNLFKKLHR